MYDINEPETDMNTKIRRRRSPAFKLAMAIVSVIVVLMILSTAALLGYSMMMKGDETPVQREVRLAAEKELNTGLRSDQINITEIIKPLPQRTNFLIMVTDEGGKNGGRTDGMMLGCYNTEDESLNLISIPRDSRTTVTDEMREGMIKGAPSSMKMTEVYHYAKNGAGAVYTVKQIEDTFGIKIQYYALMDLEGFQYVIDEIGGVEFDVPQNMFYEDPYQDLYIDIKKGRQILNGHDAMGLVRFRATYASGDIKRMEVQQAFATAAVSQVLSKDNLFKNAGTILEAVFNYVDSNLSATDALRYLDHVRRLKPENIHTYTMPYDPNNLGNYVYIDEAAAHDLVQQIFFGQ
ncbi:MAG: LCP family protein [Clostridiales bacterium]|jgi:LCP family protein required for cell wall assembly|nr:LCP family protein [Clostridiales bacterium]